jgi:hypothetical protein
VSDKSNDSGPGCVGGIFLIAALVFAIMVFANMNSRIVRLEKVIEVQGFPAPPVPKVLARKQYDRVNDPAEYAPEPPQSP